VFPGRDDRPWSLGNWQNWRKRTYAGALEAADLDHIKPYALRHSFASLLLAKGRSVHYVARQFGHAPSMTLDVYGHVIDELEDGGQIDAEKEVRAARIARSDAPPRSVGALRG